MLNAFSVVNRKNMFVYQERATKAVYYLRYVGGPWEEGVKQGSRIGAEDVCPKTVPLSPRLLETSCSERSWEGDALPPSLALSRSQEPIYSEETSARITPSPPPKASVLPSYLAPWSRALTHVSLQGPRSPLDMASSRSSDAARPVGQVDRHIQLLVHGVGQAGKRHEEGAGE